MLIFGCVFFFVVLVSSEFVVDSDDAEIALPLCVDDTCSGAAAGSQFAPLLIFSTMKPVSADDQAAPSVVWQAQRNAVWSWKQLRPRAHVVLFGDEQGTARIAADLKATHVVDVPRGPANLPLVNHLFARAERLASQLVGVKVLVYVNGDIVLTDEFARAAMRALEASERRGRPLLLIGKRYNSIALRLADLSASGDAWQSVVRRAASAIPRDLNHNNNRWAIDYFAFTPGAFGALPSGVPPFSLGVAVFDNWLVHTLNSRQAFVVDASLVVPALHQSHPIAPVDDEKRQLRERNAALAKQWHWGRIDAAPYYLAFCDAPEAHFTYGDAVPERMCVHERAVTL
jgi:hypothetical protein